MIRIKLKIWFLIPFSGDDFAILFNTESLNHVHGENNDDTSGRIEILKLITTEQKRISRIRSRIEKRNRLGVHKEKTIMLFKTLRQAIWLATSILEADVGDTFGHFGQQQCCPTSPISCQHPNNFTNFKSPTPASNFWDTLKRPSRKQGTAFYENRDLNP